MSLKLQSPPSVPPSAETPKARGDLPPASRPAALGGRLNRRAVLMSIIGVSIFAITGSAILRLPRARQVIEAKARGGESQAPIVGAAERERLVQEGARARTKLLPDRRALLAELQLLEAVAVANGWTIDSTLQPPSDSAPVGPLVQLLPVGVRLIDRAGLTAERSGFHRLPPLIEALHQSGRRIDIVKLEAHAGPAGLAGVSLEIQFWLDHSDEKIPAR